jgi:hypothetical protein
MSELRNIHKLRQGIGSQNQNRHNNEIYKIDEILFESLLTHPYSLNNEQYQRFFKEDWFRRGCNGIETQITDEYIYRFSNISKITSAVSIWHGSLLTSKNPARIYDMFYKDTSRGTRWIDLSNYAKGTYSGPRKFTFWTNLLTNSKNIYNVANKVGYPSNWMSNYIVILRIKLENLKKIKSFVPSVLDSFDSEIFHPTKDIKSPKEGITIHLNKTGELKEGVAEFVLCEIPVEVIEMKPVYLSTEEIEFNCVESDNKLWERLEFYYKLL